MHTRTEKCVLCYIYLSGVRIDRSWSGSGSFFYPGSDPGKDYVIDLDPDPNKISGPGRFRIQNPVIVWIRISNLIDKKKSSQKLNYNAEKYQHIIILYHHTELTIIKINFE